VKLDKKTLVTALTFLLIGIIVTSVVWVYASPTNTFYISGGVYPQASFTVWKEGSTYYAKNAYGQIVYSGTDADVLINNVISNAPEGSEIYLKNADYYIDASVIIDKSLSFIGESVYEDGFLAWKGVLNPDLPIELGGTVLRVTANNTRGITIQGEVTSVIIKNIGIQFDVEDTLEGLVILPAGSGYGRKGLAYGELENIAVYGNDGESYAFDLKNFMLIKAERLRSWGGGFMFLQVAESGDINWGNSVFEQCFTFTTKTMGASKPIFYISTANISGIMNLLLFERLQINSWADNYAPYGMLLEYGSYITFVGLDIETDIQIPVQIEDNSDFVTFIGGLVWSSNTTSKIVVDATSDYVSFRGMTLAVNSLDISGTNFWVETTEFKSANSGSASLATGATVSHGLVGTPTSVVLTMSVSEDVWATALGATTFTVNFDGGGTQTVYWYAEYRT